MQLLAQLIDNGSRSKNRCMMSRIAQAGCGRSNPSRYTLMFRVGALAMIG